LLLSKDIGSKKKASDNQLLADGRGGLDGGEGTGFSMEVGARTGVRSGWIVGGNLCCISIFVLNST